MKRYKNLFDEIVCWRNMEISMYNAARYKTSHREIAAFLDNHKTLLPEIIEELKNGSYRIGKYHEFFVYDPKKRLVMALPFRDRVVQWGIYRQLNPLLDKRYIDTSYACRTDHGVHLAVAKLNEFSHNLDMFCDNPYYLKMDMSKYFYRINHEVLINILDSIINDSKLMDLLSYIINSDEQKFGIEIINHKVTGRRIRGVGMPIGNLTSQMFANLYLNVLDHYCKHTLRAKKYIRYMDDVIILDNDKHKLRHYQEQISNFIETHLKLELNNKTCISTCKSGIDFCGYRVFPNYVKLRKKTYTKMMRRIRQMVYLYSQGKISEFEVQQTMGSYYGFLKHCDSYNIRTRLFGPTGKPEKSGLFGAPYVIEDLFYERTRGIKESDQLNSLEFAK